MNSTANESVCSMKGALKSGDYREDHMFVKSQASDSSSLSSSPTSVLDDPLLLDPNTGDDDCHFQAKSSFLPIDKTSSCSQGCGVRLERPFTQRLEQVVQSRLLYTRRLQRPNHSYFSDDEEDEDELVGLSFVDDFDGPLDEQ